MFLSLLSPTPRLPLLLGRSLGFNIEIKYPLEEDQISNKLQSWEMNEFVDKTLDVIFQHAGDRKIVFSCFHPDMCRVLSLKQPCYPVLFLTTSGHLDVFADARAMSLRAAVRFATSSNLLGIVAKSHALVSWTCVCPFLGGGVGLMRRKGHTHTHTHTHVHGVWVEIEVALTTENAACVLLARGFLKVLCPELIHEIKSSGLWQCIFFCFVW